MNDAVICNLGGGGGGVLKLSFGITVGKRLGLVVERLPLQLGILSYLLEKESRNI